jgi:hypothetical protein
MSMRGKLPGSCRAWQTQFSEKLLVAIAVGTLLLSIGLPENIGRQSNTIIFQLTYFFSLCGAS